MQKYLELYQAYSKVIGDMFLIVERQGEIARNHISDHQNHRWSSAKAGKPWNILNL